MRGGGVRSGGAARPSYFAPAALPPLRRSLERYVGGRLLEGGSKRGEGRRGFSLRPKIEKKGAEDDLFQNLLPPHPDLCTCLPRRCLQVALCLSEGRRLRLETK